MNQRSNQFKSFAVFMALLMAAWFISGLFVDTAETSITRSKFEERLKAGEIQEIVISQNEQVPTGVAILVCTDGMVEQYNVSDVNELQDELKAAGVDYSM